MTLKRSRTDHFKRILTLSSFLLEIAKSKKHWDHGEKCISFSECRFNSYLQLLHKGFESLLQGFESLGYFLLLRKLFRIGIRIATSGIRITWLKFIFFTSRNTFQNLDSNRFIRDSNRSSKIRIARPKFTSSPSKTLS